MTGSGFQAFAPVIPVFLLILLLLISAGVAWWSYNYLKSINPLKKYGLISLRASSLLILFILLLNPLFIKQTSWSEKPTVLVYLDNSQSVQIERGDYSGISDYQLLIDQFEFANNESINYLFYKFDSTVERNESILIDGRGSNTNLDAVFKHQAEQAPDAIAALLFSDGIITQGRDPVFSAQNSLIPFFTVPVGDTASANDIALTDFDPLQSAYTNTQFSVNTILQQDGYKDETVTVQLFENGEMIDQKEVTFNESRSSHEVRFDLVYEDPGIIDFEIRVPPLDDELTTENNSVFFSVDVEDDKTLVWYLAFEIHPDVGAFRNLIARDQSFEIKAYTYTNSGKFIGGNPDDTEEQPDMIVVHGLPQNVETISWIIDKMQSYSTLFVATPSSFRQLERQGGLFYGIDQAGSYISVKPEIREREYHPIFDLDPVQTNRMPSLQTLFGQYRLSPAQQVLGFTLFQNERTEIPYLLIEETGNTRNLFLNAFDWYKFTQSRQPEIRDFINQFITNITSWVSVPSGSTNLQISTIRSSFNENENIIIRATLQNESGLPETDGLIEVDIQSSEVNDRGRVFTMQHQSNGNYQLNAGTLPPGRYQYKAEARIGSRFIEDQRGSFSVASSTREFLDTKRNDQRLQQLAEITGGEFLNEDAPSAFLAALEERNLLQTVERSSTEFLYLHQFYFWFFLVLVTLSSEWILRRTISLP